MPGRRDGIRDVGPDESRPAGNQHSHGRSLWRDHPVLSRSGVRYLCVPAALVKDVRFWEALHRRGHPDTDEAVRPDPPDRRARILQLLRPGEPPALDF